MGIDCSCFSSETLSASIDMVNKSPIAPLRFEPPDAPHKSSSLNSLSRRYLSRKHLKDLTDPLKKYQYFYMPISSFQPLSLLQAENLLKNPFQAPQPGPVYLINSEYYQGTFNKLCQKHGEGILITKDNKKYEGQFKGNEFSGVGRLIFENGDVYEGFFKRSQAHGIGKFVQHNGLVYHGEFKKDKQHGQGQETWGDGYKYEGHYKKGQKHGKGCIKYTNESSYTGDFYLNKIQGSGIYQWSEQKWYKGQFLDNKMHGYGELHSQSGLVYKGNFEDDKKNGFGTCLWPDSRVYKGGWKNDLQDGEGKFSFIDKNGEKIVKAGVWKDGKRLYWLDGSLEDTAKVGFLGIRER